MAGKLTAAFVKSARHSGRTGRPEKHYDMHGLFLQVLPSGSKQFVQRLVVAGKRSDYGLGGYPIISLAEAREAAWENRRAARRGEVPQVEAPPVAGGPRGPTFAAAFEQVLAFYDFAAAHWAHLRATNVIESAFATIRHRSSRAKGCVARKTMLSMVHKMGRCAEKSWRRLRGFRHLAKVIEGVRFNDGIEDRRAAA